MVKFSGLLVLRVPSPPLGIVSSVISAPLIPPALDPLVMIVLPFLFSINCTVFHMLVFGFHPRGHRIN